MSRLLLAVFVLCVAGCAAPRPAAPAAVDTSPLPGPAREFRGAWIATVANIDWPSRRGLPADSQRAELVALLDLAVQSGLNAVILQVRPACDALYASPLEPWSEYLTGRQGGDPGYDPLAFAVEAAHARGLQLHAWFNPYRAGHPTHEGPYDPSHISQRRPDLVKTYGTNRWLDPGEPDAAAHSLAVILDVVQRYDVDGVHIDDYFYPYPVREGNRKVPFPDSASYARARAAGETLAIDDWRRQNVDRFVEALYREVKAAKPHVLVGVSPFGIWRPGHPPTVTGFDQFAEIYADARRWQHEGWLDYFAPQLYWAIASPGQSFPALLGWWGEQNTAGRHLWPGLFTSRTLPEDGSFTPQEVVDQVALAQADDVATGTIHFSLKSFWPRYSDVGARLAAERYAALALVPASPWLDAVPPPAPALTLDARGALQITAPADDVASWIVRQRHGSAWTWALHPARQTTVALAAGHRPDAVAVSAVDRAGNEGPAARLALPTRR